MKQSNALLALLIGITAISCSYGMDLATSRIGDNPPRPMKQSQTGFQAPSLDFLSQSTRFEEPDPSEEMYKPLAKPSFLKFYESVNAYLKEKKQNDLAAAKNSLQEIIVHKSTIGLHPFSTFLQSNNPDESLVEELKPWFNTYYFSANKNDLCKAIPYFLKNMTSTNQSTIGDTARLLKQLKQTSDSAAEKNIAKIEREISSIDTNIQLTDDTLRHCWQLLDEVCNIMPRKAFQDASHNLTEQVLMPLLQYNGTPEHDKYIIEPAIKNIDTLIDFISQQKRSEKNARITQLEGLKKTILQKTKEKTLSLEDVKEAIDTIEYITEATLNPDELMESSLQLEQLQQEKEEFQQEQERLAKEQEAFEKEQEKINDTVLLTDPKYLIVDNPDKLLDYMNRKNWDEQTKTYALQLLFWFAQKEAIGQEVINRDDTVSASRQVNILKELRKIGAQAPGVMRKRGYKNNKSIGKPVFTFDLQVLPEDAPASLKELFTKLKEQELENQRENPQNVIKAYAGDIKELREYLSLPNENFKWATEQLTNLEKMTATAKEFYSQYGTPSTQTDEDIAQVTSDILSRKERKPKATNIPKHLILQLYKTPEEPILQFNPTPEELEKMVSQNQQLAQKKATKELIANQSTGKTEKDIPFEPDHSKRISEKFAASLSTKQTEMEKLIQEQVDKLNKQLAQTDDLPALKLIASQLDNYATYASEASSNLQKSISETQIITKNKILAHEHAQKINAKLALLGKAINSDTAKTQTLANLIQPLEEMKKDPSISLAQTSEIRALMVTAKEKLHGNQEAPQEKTATIKKTIAKEAFDNVKENVKANGIEWLFKQENYNNFPNDFSLACLFEIIEIFIEMNRLHVEVIQALEPKSSAPYATIISQLNDYIAQSIIPAKIDTIRNELIPFISNIPTLMQQQIEKEIENKKLLDKQTQEAEAAKEKALAEKQTKDSAAFDKMIAAQARELERLKAAKEARDAQAKTTAAKPASSTAEPTQQAQQTELEQPSTSNQTTLPTSVDLTNLSPELAKKIEQERIRIKELVQAKGDIILCDPQWYENLPNVTSLVCVEALITAVEKASSYYNNSPFTPSQKPIELSGIGKKALQEIRTTLDNALTKNEIPEERNIPHLKVAIERYYKALSSHLEKLSALEAPIPAPEEPSTPLRTILSFINAPINFVINVFSGIGSAIGSWFSWLTGGK